MRRYSRWWRFLMLLVPLLVPERQDAQAAGSLVPPFVLSTTVLTLSVVARVCMRKITPESWIPPAAVVP